MSKNNNNVEKPALDNNKVDYGRRAFFITHIQRWVRRVIFSVLSTLIMGYAKWLSKKKEEHDLKRKRANRLPG